MSNSELSFIVSSMYDLLKPDGVNVMDLSNGKYQLMRPASLSNLHNIAFRSFTGELLPFTSIDLPKLKAELVMMTNGLKSVTMSGQDTLDLSAVNTYENTKQNVILSVDKAWTYNPDADSQIIYNVQEIVELMNEKLKDYFIYTGTVSSYVQSPDFQTFFDSSVRIFKNTYMSAVLQDVSTNEFKVWQIDRTARTVTAIPFDQHLTPLYCRICFIDYLSNAGLWMTYDDDGNNALATVVSYDSTKNKYKYNNPISIVPKTGMLGDLYLRGSRAPPGICVSFSSMNSLNMYAFAYLESKKASDETPHLVIHASIDGLYNEKDVSFADVSSWPTLESYNQIYFIGFEPLSKDLYIAITYDANPTNSSRITYAKVTLTGFDIYKGNTSATISLSTNFMNYTQLGEGLFIDWYNSRMDLAANTNFVNIPLISADTGKINMANQFMLEYNGTAVTKCQGFSRNFFKLGPTSVYCREYDPVTQHYHLCRETSPDIQLTRTMQLSEDDFVITYEAGAITDYDIGPNQSGLSLIPFKVYTSLAPNAFYFYDERYYEYEESFNESHVVNCKDVSTLNVMNVACSAVDSSDNAVALNPANNGYLCSNVDDFIKLDDITVDNGSITGRITIPQIEFASDYVLNFNLKIYSDPYYFNIYTSRDFTQQGHNYNLDVNHTNLYYRASNSHVLNTLEYLILLKYNYNLIKLRVNGFPNSDGMVFNMNENSYVSFKNMPTDNTMNSLIVELIGDDNEALPPEILQQLFGKVSLAIDWMQ